VLVLHREQCDLRDARGTRLSTPKGHGDLAAIGRKRDNRRMRKHPDDIARRGSGGSETFIAQVMDRYPPADTITPEEFEHFVADVLGAAGSECESFEVTIHEVIRGSDGSYDFDATARFEVAGMNFLVLVEAKRHKSPIKRELVQTLHQKMLSVGANKALLVAASRFQTGAVEFALSHGIALATLSEGRLAYETRSLDSPAALSFEQARALKMPDFTAMLTRRDQITGAIRGSALSSNYPDLFLDWVCAS